MPRPTIETLKPGPTRLIPAVSIRFLLGGGAAMVIALLVSYWNSWNVPFVFDDVRHIPQNPHVLGLETFSISGLADVMRESPGNRPLSSLTFGLNYLAGGLNVTGYHALNTLIHAINGLLVALLATILFDRMRPVRDDERSTGPPTVPPAAWCGLAVGLLFITHPIQTQAVTYVVQRMTSLATMFYLGALLCFLAGRVSRSLNIQIVSWLGCLTCWLLALGSKEIAVTLPVALLLCEWFVFQQADRKWLARGAALAVPAAILILCVAFAFKGGSLGYLLTDGYTRFRDFTLIERVLTQPRVVLHYLSLIALPLPQRLTLVYDFPISRSLFSPFTTVLSLGAIIGAITGALVWARRAPLIAFGILWFFLHLAVESTVLPLEMVYEHRVYMPLLGPLVIIAAIMPQIVRSRAALLALLVATTVLLAAGTHVRNRAYSDKLTLWTDNASKQPSEARSHLNIAVVHLEQREYAKALERATRAIEFEPRFHRAYVISAACRINALDLEGALGDLNTAMSIKEEEIRYEPDLGRALGLRGGVYVDLGRPALAARDLNAAIKGRPDLPGPYYHRGRLHAMRGEYRAAVADFEKALERSPGLVDAHNNLAWWLATCPDPAIRDGFGAVEHAEFASEALGGENVSALDTLAAAYARAMDFEKAVATQQKVIELAPPEKAGAYEARLRLYEQGEPYTSGR